MSGTITDTERVEINNSTATRVGMNLKVSFQKFKILWEDKNREIRKLEKKEEKITEELYCLKEERSNLEDHLESIRTAFESYCEETGIKFDLS